jgi:hypothetical protein
MKTMFGFLLLLIITSILLPAQLQAQSINFALGGQADYNGKSMLDIRINANGTWLIYSDVTGTMGYSRLFTTEYHDVFSIKIDNTVFYAVGQFISSILPSSTTRIQLTISDVDNNTDPSAVVQYVTKRYSSAYDGNSFYVDLTVRYDKNDPGNIILTAEINAENIPSTATISLAYGGLIMMGNLTRHGAILSPSLLNNGLDLSISQISGTYAFTKGDIQKLYMVGCVNTSNTVIPAFYTIGGRQFDMASAKQIAPHHAPYLFPNYLNYNYAGYAGVFNFDRTSDGSLDVGYEDIPGGETTTISTGLFITSTFPAEMDYFFGNSSTYSKHITVAMNEPANLRMVTRNYNGKAVDNVGFRFDIPTTPISLPFIGTPTYSSFTSATYDYDGTTYHQVTDGIIPSLGSGIVTIPVSTAMYGEWTIDQSNLSVLSYIASVGTRPATLTVTTTANYALPTPTGVLTGDNATLTVKLPDTFTAHKDIVVNLTYSGAGSLSSPPATMTILQGDNSGTFTVTGATAGQVTITITDTDYAAVIPGANKTATLTVEPKVYYIPVNPHLRSMIVKQ